MTSISEAFPRNNLASEDGAHELATSPDMKPYLNLIMAGMQGMDTTAQRQALAELPVERRYVWRIASALKWAFGDFDDVNVAADLETLRADDLAKVIDLLRFRPIQFCMFLKALVGTKHMLSIMTQAMNAAKETE